MNHMAWLLCLSSFLMAPVATPAQQEIEFSGSRWETRGQVEKRTHLGREALLFRNGVARLVDVDFESGTIEFDMATTGVRSFSGIAFRVGESGIDLDNFYLRPHNSGRFDAMQYTPVYGRVAAWQLYPEFNAAIEIPVDRWLHVRLVVNGPRLDVFFEDDDEPTLTVDRLRGRHRSGAVEIRGNFPAGQPADLYPTAFSRVSVRPAATSAPFVDEPAPPNGFIASWSVSPSLPSGSGPVETLPAIMPPAAEWVTADADAAGRVNLAAWRTFPAAARSATVFARVVLRAERQQTVKLNLGFSDRASFFLDGRLVFTGDNGYRSRSQRYLGVMTVEHEALYLDLDKGDHELLVAVTERFGGWGLTARLAAADGITVEARPPGSS